MCQGAWLIGVSFVMGVAATAWREDRLRTVGLVVAGWLCGMGTAMLGDALFDALM